MDGEVGAKEDGVIVIAIGVVSSAVVSIVGLAEGIIVGDETVVGSPVVVTSDDRMSQNTRSCTPGKSVVDISSNVVSSAL